MNPKTVLGVLALTLGLLLGFSLAHYEILNITSSIGVSNGPPYCLFCVSVKTSLMKPEVGDYATHNQGDSSVLHKVVGVNSSHYLLVYHWRDEVYPYSIPLNDSSVQKVLHIFYIYTTEDFDYAWSLQEKTIEIGL